MSNKLLFSYRADLDFLYDVFKAMPETDLPLRLFLLTYLVNQAAHLVLVSRCGCHELCFIFLYFVVLGKGHQAICIFCMDLGISSSSSSVQQVNMNRLHGKFFNIKYTVQISYEVTSSSVLNGELYVHRFHSLVSLQLFTEWSHEDSSSIVRKNT